MQNYTAKYWSQILLTMNLSHIRDLTMSMEQMEMVEAVFDPVSSSFQTLVQLMLSLPTFHSKNALQ